MGAIDDGSGGHGKRLSHYDYTVGWICALDVELTAVKLMLDNVHDSLPTSRGDTNTYTYGNIGMHNIVIACLPSGRYGLTNAATVAENMRRSFPAVRFGLMVGIGGGVPGKADVRLGDVVVSKEVVQYDFGKTNQDGYFRRTGSLNKPPHILMTAVAKLQADHRSKPSNIPSILSEMINRYPEMIGFTYTSTLQDRLFDSAYDHLQPADQPVDSCEHCDASRIVKRPARRTNDPKIHYGVIASANQVMKHGRTRDQLAEELDVLCFEMEAAGLMDSFPCLIVRGICDYSDSHKNKRWQEYAAATAAAYAKELLSVISAEITDGPLHATAAFHDYKQQKDRRKKLLDSLEFNAIHARRLGVKAADEATCKWLLEDPVYQRWLDPAKVIEHHGFLWIKGSPGVGKSTIIKFAYSHATDMMTDTAIISFFFNARGESLENSVLGMYRSLLWELLSKVPKLQEILDHSDLIPLSRSDSPAWGPEILRTLFSRAIAKLGEQRLFCFVDALDECDRNEVYEMVQNFQDLVKDAVSKGSLLHICVSSRHYPSIDIEDGQQLILEHHDGHDKDLEAYIFRKLKLGKGSEAQADELRNEIRVRANGVFLWAELVVQMLNKEFGRGSSLAIRRKRLKEIPTRLSELFKDILRREDENSENLLLSIEWILYAKQPLRWEELYFALISGLHPDLLAAWDQEEITIDDMKQFILSSSRGLAEITKPQIHTVQFIHESVRDFLLKEKGLSDLRREMGLQYEDFESSLHEQLKEYCHMYINLDITAYVPLDAPLPMISSDEAEALKSSVSGKFPFLEYVTRHILHHADSAGDELPQDNFLKCFDLKSWIRLDNLFEDRRRSTSTAGLLCILIENGLTNLIKPTLRLDSSVDMQGKQHHYPYSTAVANGNQDAVTGLLQPETSTTQEEDIHALLNYRKDMEVSEDESPLVWAFAKGNMSLAVRLMASKTFSPNWVGRNGNTPLTYAAIQENESAVASLLAAEDINPNLKDRYGDTPLLLAVKGREMKGVVRLLLAANGIDPNSKDRVGKPPLIWATLNEYKGITSLLLATEGIDPNLRDNLGRSPLSIAAERGNEGMARLLLSSTATDPNLKDGKRSQPPLTWAATQGHGGVVALLLAVEGIDPNLKDGKLSQSPLTWAAMYGQEGAVALLLAAEGIDINSKSASGMSPLLWAARCGMWDIVTLLLAHEGIDINSEDSHGHSPLSLAIGNGHTNVARLLQSWQGTEKDQ